MNSKKTWWKESVIYQIYPRSFNDSNGDGVGDLRGIIDKLDYLKQLGIDIVWLCPVYESPNDDNGYDVSNYQSISSEFGTMDDFDELLAGLHERGIKLIMDLVVNHSSDEHRWFMESRKSKDNPYRDYYIWKDPKADGGPPNNWVSFFGGSAWEWDESSQQYYLHLFSKKQPDLNWENPDLRKEVYEMMHFWLQKGVDGFRMDVIPFISKYQDFPDIDPDDFFTSVVNVYANGPRLHEFLQEMNSEVLSKYDVMTVGEATGVLPEQALLYVGEDRKELNMIFHFGHMFMDSGPKGRYDTIETDLVLFKQVFTEWEESTKDGGWLSIFLGNHDFPRAVSRFGDDGEYHEKSAMLLATMILSLKGTPYIYQGDEFGMTNLKFREFQEIKDIDGINYYREAYENGMEPQEIIERINRHGRDNARTPIQWGSGPNADFSSSPPWLKVNENYKQINADLAISNPDSVFHFHRNMIRLRKENQVLIYGDYQPLLEDHSSIFAYERKLENDQVRVLLNFSSEVQKVDLDMSGNWERLIGNYKSEEARDLLRPWESIVLRKL